MTAWLSEFVADERGQDLIEYGLLAVFIAVAAVVSIQLMGLSVGQLWDGINTQLAAIFG